MQISVSIDSSRLGRRIAGIEKQVIFAARRSLTEVGRAARDEMATQVVKDLDRPTPFTRRGFYSTAARGDRLVTVVGIKDKQAEYLKYQVAGGSRAPRKQAIRTPQKVSLNKYGNIPARTMATLIAAARGEKRFQKRTGKRIGVSSKATLFYGEPGDGRPPGIYKRVPAPGQSDGRLIAIVSMPKRPAVYRPRLRFHETVRRVVQRDFGLVFARELARALVTAR